MNKLKVYYRTQLLALLLYILHKAKFLRLSRWLGVVAHIEPTATTKFVKYAFFPLYCRLQTVTLRHFICLAGKQHIPSFCTICSRAAERKERDQYLLQKILISMFGGARASQPSAVPIFVVVIFDLLGLESLRQHRWTNRHGL